MKEQPTNDYLSSRNINAAICNDGFSKHTVSLIDDYINDIFNGKANFTRFNQPEHAGLCRAGKVLIGAYIVCNYARASLETSTNAAASEGGSTNWEIDELQEKYVQQWAEAKKCWFPDAEQELQSEYGAMIAQGAEAKVYYKDGDTSVIKMRTSIYATLGKALESIILHNALFPETPMNVVGFTRDSDGLFRSILTQPYIGCKRLATKLEIDQMVAENGFRDNADGLGVNYISERIHLEDMHPANVFIDILSDKPICIDCIVKFKKK